ncbi:hypothetical protein MXB_3919, partial [Myxobolus squamalis]
MSRTTRPRQTKKPFSIFDFSIYKNFVSEYTRKIESEVDDQIKCLYELENQVDSVINDEKSCVFSETPSQKRKRLFPTSAVFASSPVKERPIKSCFQSVLRPNTVKLTHFDEDFAKQKLDFDDIKINTEKQSSFVVKQAEKRRLSTRLFKEPPIKIKNFNTPKLKPLVELSLKDGSVDISVDKVLEEKKEKRRLQAAAVEQRRKALDEERKLKLSKKNIE